MQTHTVCRQGCINQCCGYRICYRQPNVAKQGRGHIKQPGALDKLDITQESD
ncbi:hypothetical protein J6590_038180 [Homalodisca vitripennis]|nr:hypothetical protein J6590_038180 [Homalodisca vitripennis]